MGKRQEKRPYHHAAAQPDEEPRFAQGPIGFRGYPLNAAASAFVFKYFFALGFLYMVPSLFLMALFEKVGIGFGWACLFFLPCGFSHLIWYGSKMSKYMD